MYRRLILHTFLLLISFASFGQIQVIKTNVYFGVNQSKLSAEAITSLDKTMDSLRSTDILKVILKGNSDNVGADSLYNMILSQKRADTVLAYLIKKNVSTKLTSTTFFGGDKPIADNSTEEGRKLNRRVEVLISCKHKAVLVDTPDKVINMIVKAPKVTDPHDSIVRQWRNRWGWYLGCGGVRGGRECWEIIRDIDSLNPPTKDSITLTADSLGSTFDFATFRLDTVPAYCRDSQRCKNVPFQILIPITKEIAPLKTLLKSVKLYEGVSGKWEPSTETISIVKSGGRDCIEMLVHCARAWFSCRIVDPYDAMLKVRVPRRYSVSSFSSYYDQPFMVTFANKTDMPNIVNAKLINMTHPGLFKVKLLNRKGQTSEVSIPISDVISKAELGNLFKSTANRDKSVQTKAYRIKGRMIKAALAKQ